MHNYPGSITPILAHFARLDAGTAQYEKSQITRREEMREAAKNGGNVEYNNGFGYCIEKPADLIENFMRTEILLQAYTAWIAGDIEGAKAMFVSACELAFEDAIDHMATCDVEFLGD